MSDDVILRAEVSQRRVRAVVDGQVLVDSRAPRLVYEAGRHPTYWFPSEDIAWDLLSEEQSAAVTPKGLRRSWQLRTSARTVPAAVWSYPHRPPGAAGIDGHVRVAWAAVDAWYEEDEEIFHYPRDPYRRVDALRSSRNVQVDVGGTRIATSSQPVLVFETGLPVRFYLPPPHVDHTLLRPSDTTTACQYKGVTRYWHAVVEGVQYDDIAWSYPVTVPSLPGLAGLIGFAGPHIALTVDGEAWTDDM